MHGSLCAEFAAHFYSSHHDDHSIAGPRRFSDASHAHGDADNSPVTDEFSGRGEKINIAVANCNYLHIEKLRPMHLLCARRFARKF